MTNDEPKKKIVDTIMQIKGYFVLQAEQIADALIAAGIGDVSKWKAYAKVHRIVITKDDKIKQLYSDEEVDKIVIERVEYKHRAEVAEMALRMSISFLTCRACQAFLYGPCDTDARGDERCINNFLKQAEKELAEEGKDD